NRDLRIGSKNPGHVQYPIGSGTAVVVRARDDLAARQLDAEISRDRHTSSVRSNVVQARIFKSREALLRFDAVALVDDEQFLIASDRQKRFDTADDLVRSVASRNDD